MKTVGNTQFVSISKAKGMLPELADTDKPTVLLRYNEPVAAVLSIEKYNDYLALEKLIRNPAIFDRLRAKAKKARNTPIKMLRSMEDLERLSKSPQASNRADRESRRAASR